jgi:hypothetical protein
MDVINISDLTPWPNADDLFGDLGHLAANPYILDTPTGYTKEPALTHQKCARMWVR